MFRYSVKDVMSPKYLKSNNNSLHGWFVETTNRADCCFFHFVVERGLGPQWSRFPFPVLIIFYNSRRSRESNLLLYSTYIFWHGILLAVCVWDEIIGTFPWRNYSVKAFLEWDRCSISNKKKVDKQLNVNCKQTAWLFFWAKELIIMEVMSLISIYYFSLSIIFHNV